MSPWNCGRNQIHFIIAPKRFRNAFLSSKSMPGADCSSDHVPVVCFMRIYVIKLKKLEKPKQTPKFHHDALKQDVELKWKFNVAIENKFAVLDKLGEVEQKWEQMRKSLKECAKEFI
ncbi:craniofacial development protein 2-like [Elysia marginata]|uniref:Craniofacial development protein 2-like n=1 Tax=Elysia marginata TaxID=1093978 RepID=A0AAV4IXK4_9GAST|nr:craniofacial development protein 2-like [Elysia marginata]